MILIYTALKIEAITLSIGIRTAWLNQHCILVERLTTFGLQMAILLCSRRENVIELRILKKERMWMIPRSHYNLHQC